MLLALLWPSARNIITPCLISRSGCSSPEVLLCFLPESVRQTSCDSPTRRMQEQDCVLGKAKCRQLGREKSSFPGLPQAHQHSTVTPKWCSMGEELACGGNKWKNGRLPWVQTNHLWILPGIALYGLPLWFCFLRVRLGPLVQFTHSLTLMPQNYPQSEDFVSAFLSQWLNSVPDITATFMQRIVDVLWLVHLKRQPFKSALQQCDFWDSLYQEIESRARLRRWSSGALQIGISCVFSGAGWVPWEKQVVNWRQWSGWGDEICHLSTLEIGSRFLVSI